MREDRGETVAGGRFAILYQFIRYGQASAISASLTLGLPILLVELFGVDPNAAAAIGLTAAYIVNFVTLRAYVFRSKVQVRGQILRYLLVSLIMRLGEYAVYYGLHNVLDVNYGVALAGVLLVSSLSKFFFFRKIVFT